MVTAPAVVAQSIQSNLNRLQRLYIETIDSVFTDIDLSGKRVVVQGSAPDSLQARIFKDQALKYLTGQNAVMAADTASDDDLVLKYTLIGHNIDYDKIKRKRFKRRVTVETHCRLRDRENILVSDIIQVSGTDTVNTSNPQSLEDEKYKFTTGTEKSGILEPVLVSALTGAIIYIFYSYRSQ